MLFDEIMNDLDVNHLKNKKLWLGASQVISISAFTDKIVSKLNSNSNFLASYFYKKYMDQNHFTIFNSCIKEALIWTLRK